MIAPWVIDNELAGAPMSEDGTSGIKNLNYLFSASVIKRDFKVFKEDEIIVEIKAEKTLTKEDEAVRSLL